VPAGRRTDGDPVGGIRGGAQEDRRLESGRWKIRREALPLHRVTPRRTASQQSARRANIEPAYAQQAAGYVPTAVVPMRHPVPLTKHNTRSLTRLGTPIGDRRQGTSSLRHALWIGDRSSRGPSSQDSYALSRPSFVCLLFPGSAAVYTKQGGH